MDAFGARTVIGITMVMVCSVISFAYISAQIGVLTTAEFVTIWIIIGSLAALFAIGLVFAVIVVAALVDRLVKVVRR